MGLSSTLYSGISGLQTNADAMSVIGNNISNSNTVGFKSSSTVFADTLSASIASMSGDDQVGRGTDMSSVRNDFSQGSFQSTANNTDLAIEGDGFFMLSAPDSPEMFYSRNGAFSFDSQGYLVNDGGYRVQGQLFNADGSPGGGDPRDIQINLDSQIPARATANIELTTNLDSGSGLVGPFDIANPAATSNYSTSTQVYDALGETHLTTTYFTKVDDQTWQWHTVVNSDELDPAVAGAEDLTEVGSGVLTFDVDGELVSGGQATTTAGALAWNNGADPNQQLAFDFNTTQFSSSSVVFSQVQDGYGPGEVVDTAIGSDGVVSVNYSNGETIDIATLTLATFANPGGLNKAGGSLYGANSASGSPRVGTPGTSQGTIFTNSLELSNVDLSQEFVNMITIQNGYSASSRVITTTDEMLQELLNLKR